MTERCFRHGFILLLILCLVGLTGHILADAMQHIPGEHITALHGGIILSKAPAPLYAVPLLLLGAAAILVARPWSPPTLLRPPIAH